MPPPAYTDLQTQSIYRDYYGRIETGREMYISDIYKLMLQQGEKIRGVRNMEGKDTIILGTPRNIFPTRIRCDAVFAKNIPVYQ